MEYSLSIANIEFLKREICNAGLTYSHLQDDMIDHVCCDVEYEMQSGLPFEKAYNHVKEKIGLGGLMRVQEDTMYLIDKNYRTMKKLMKISGVVAPVLIALGTLCRIEHWPGAGIILLLGFFALGFLFLPSAVYITYKEVSNKSMKLAHISGFFSAFLIFTSFGFKIMHWPGTVFVLLAGILIACTIFLPSLLINKLKEATNEKPKMVYILGFLGLVIYLLGFLFKVQHWPGAAILLLTGAILLVFVAFPWYIYLKFRNHETVTNNYIFMVIALIWFVVPTMLISINVSAPTLHGFEQLEYAANNHIKLLESRSNGLYGKLLPADANPLNEQQKRIAAVKTSIDSLSKFMYQIKANIVRTADGQNAANCFSPDGEILIYRIDNKTSTESVSKVFSNNSKPLAMLKKQMVAARSLLTDNQNVGNELKKIIQLGFSGDLDNNNWERNTFKNTNVIGALNMLSEIEEGIMIAENAWLTEQSNLSVSALALQNNNKK